MAYDVIKVALSIEIQGRVCKQQIKRVPVTKTYYDKKQKKEVETTFWQKEIVSVFTPAYHHLNINEEAYKYMTSAEPFKCPPSTWKKMNAIQRLEHHFKNICDTLGGSKFTYEIVE